jgi:predicted secreted protein
MQPISAVAVFFLIWFLCLFVVLPFGIRTDREMGMVPNPGNAESAPHQFRAGRIILRTTILAAIVFGLFYANYNYGWIGIDFLDFLKPESIRKAG